MSKLKLTLAAAVLTLVASRGFAVTNAVVGTCVAGTHYTTIQAAVNAATSPSTVQICPGTYQEQIEIKSALTLKGVTQGTSNSVVILPPAKGLAYNSLSGLFGKLFVNVYVHANAAVTISNITIDGGGGTACPATGYRVGLLYQGGGGSVTNSSFVDSPTCAKPIAAMADVTSGFTFTNNTLADCGGAASSSTMAIRRRSRETRSPSSKMERSASTSNRSPGQPRSRTTSSPAICSAPASIPPRPPT